jgi:hypothetical protein
MCKAATWQSHHYENKSKNATVIPAKAHYETQQKGARHSHKLHYENKTPNRTSFP